MSLSQAAGDTGTVIMKATPTGGSIVEEQVDATEDREIVGFDISPDEIAPSNQGRYEAELFVGSNPDATDSDGAEDIGSKFYARAHCVVENDDTNGTGWSLGEGSDSVSRPDGDGWDWNEDVTLTFAVEEHAGDSPGGFVATVYYREV